MRRKGYGMYIAAVIVVFIFGVLFFLGTIRHSNDSAQTSDIAAPTLTDENNKSTEETATSGMPGSVHDQDEQDAESDTATSSNSEASKEINTEGLDTASNIPDGYETVFTEFAVSDTSSQKNNGYAERVEPITGKTNYEVKQEQLNKLNLTPVLSDSGYPMSVFNGQYTLYTGTDSDGNTLQFGGSLTIQALNRANEPVGDECRVLEGNYFAREYHFRADRSALDVDRDTSNDPVIARIEQATRIYNSATAVVHLIDKPLPYYEIMGLEATQN